MYAYALDQAGTTFHRVATISSGFVGVMDLQYDRDLGRLWAVCDDGLSRNGSYVNGARIGGRRALLDGDVLRFGKTDILFRAPFQAGEETRAATQLGEDPPA